MPPSAWMLGKGDRDIEQAGVHYNIICDNEVTTLSLIEDW